MPPLQALVALHGLWALALLPVGVWAVRQWPPVWLRVIGYALSAVAMMAFTILIGRDLLAWYPAGTSAQQKYIAQRILYVLGTNTDVPVLQVILAGIVMLIVARRRQRVGQETE